MKNIYFVLCALLISFNSSAQWSHISHANLSGYSDNGIVYTGTSVIMATDGGIFRSTDNGSTWQKSNSGLDTADISARDITVFNGKVWVASQALYSSSNDGQSWTPAALTGLSPFGGINAMAKKGNKLFINYTYWDNNLNNQLSVLCYTSDGINWQYGDTLDIGGNNWYEFLNDNELGVMFTDNGEDTVFYSADGLTLNYLSRAGLPANASVKRRLLSIDPLGNNLFFSDENSANIYKYDFGTQTWVLKMNGISGQVAVFGVHSLGDLVFSSVYIATPIPAIKIYRSLDTANTWTVVSNPGILFPMFQSQMVKAGSNRLICNDLFYDLYTSDNNGLLWTKNTNIMSYMYPMTVGLNNGNLFTIRSNYGLLKSTDNGVSWAQSNGDLPNFMGMLYFANDLITDGTDMYVASSDQPDGPQNIYKSINNGVNWTVLANAPDSSRIRFMGYTGNKLLALFSDGNQGTYQYSSDGGATWFNLSPAIANLQVTSVLGFKGNNDTLFLFAYYNNSQKKIYRSVNNGVSFAPLNTGIDQPGLELLVDNEWDWRLAPSPVASMNANNQDLTLAVRNNTLQPNQIRFYRLNTAQTSWVEVSPSGVIIPNNAIINSLKSKNNVWYLTTSIGVFASVYNCQSWGKVWNNQGLQLGMQNKSLVILSNLLILGTNGTGIWKAPLTPPSLTTDTVTTITGTRALGGGTITNTGALPFVNKGLCWSVNANPTVLNSHVFSGTSSNSFSDNITGLTPGTLYHVRAFIITHNDTIYGNDVSFNTTILTSAMINPVTADYGLSNPGSLTTNITWNDAQNIISIVDNNSYTLIPVDYSVAGNLLTINHSYLAANLTSAGQTLTLTINFNLGNSATFTITAVQQSVLSATINPDNVNFDITYPASVSTQITWNDASGITSIVDNQPTPYTLLPTDFNLAGNTLNINSSYLASVLTASGQQITLTINFNAGNAAHLIVHATQTIINNATLTHELQPFFINAPTDVKTKIVWNDAASVTQIVDDQTTPYTLQTGDYSVIGDSLVINQNYLAGVLISLNDTIRLNVSFNIGAPSLFKIYGDMIVGVAENNSVTNIALHPNPASIYTYLEAPQAENAQIEIISMEGRLIKKITTKEKVVRLDLEGISEGMYMIKYASINQITLKKLIVFK